VDGVTAWRETQRVDENRLKSVLPKSDTPQVATIARDTQDELLHRLIETQRLLNAGSLDLDRVMAVVLERAQVATSALGGAVELSEGGAMEYRTVSGMTDAPLGARFDADAGLSGLCARLGMPLICRDTESDSRVDREQCRQVGTRSMVVAPIVHGGQGVGVLKVFSDEPDRFSDTDADVLELLAGFIASSFSPASRLENEAQRALQDPLTGLPNRMILMDRLQQAVYDARRYARPFGLFVIEPEGVDAVSVALGRDATEAVLRAIATGLEATVRSGDTLARVEDEQFVILCINADRAIVEERIRSRVDTVLGSVSNEIGLDGVDLGASVGVVWSSGSDASAESLLTSASTAAYRARRQRLQAV
jgi:diguanylate cyclase (GGDEF)-like protein